MTNKKEKTIKYRIKVGTQWLLVSLLTTSTILPGITATVSASARENTVSQNSDMSQSEEILKDNENIEPLSLVENDEKSNGEAVSSEDVNAQNNDTNDIEKTVRELDDIASGKFGTAEWRIDNQGTLYIEEGEFSDTTSSLSPWNDWAKEITNIHFNGKVVAGDSIAGLFRGIPNLVSIENIQNLDTSNTTDMREVFKESSSLKSLDLTSWNTSKVTTIYGIFQSASSLEEINVSNWDASNFTQLAYAFCNLPNLKYLDLSQWSPVLITDKSVGILARGCISMFEGASSLEELDLSGFNTVNMDYYYNGKTSSDNMFSGMESLKVVTLGKNFRFNSIYYKNAAFPDIVANDMYTGGWVNVGNGTIDLPESSIRHTSSTKLAESHKVGGDLLEQRSLMSVKELKAR